MVKASLLGPNSLDKKPDDWEQPETIVIPRIIGSEDWNGDIDGEWILSFISIPDFKVE